MALQNFTIEYGVTIGNANITGSSGNVNTSGYVNANFITVGNTISVTGNANVGNLGATNANVTAITVTGNATVGNISATSIVGTLTTASQTNITSVGTLGSLSVTGNATVGNISATSIVGTLTTASQTNITSVGTLGSLNVTGNATVGNISAAAAVITANATFGNINSVSGILSVSGNANVGNLGAGNAVISASTVSTNTTSGALTVAGGVGITGNLNAGTSTASHIITGNVTITGNITVSGDQTIIGTTNTFFTDNVIELHDLANGTGAWVTDDGRDIGIRVHYYKGSDQQAFFGWENASQSLAYYYQATETSGVISGSYGTFKGNIFNSTATAGTAPFIVNSTTQVANLNAAFSGTVTSNSQPNITSVGTLGSLSVTGNATVGNISATSIVGTLTTASQTNITSVGTLGSLSVTGNATVGNISAVAAVITSTAMVGNTLTVNTANIATAIANGGTAGIGNIGAVGQGFDTLYARQASANYADLAEIYSSDDVYEYGTVVVFGGDQEITISTVSHDSRVAGVISQQPAFLMNDTASGLPVALTGRVPCRVLGPVTKGALLTSSNIAGVAMVMTADQYVPGCVLGKSLENNHNGGTLIIEAVIGRM